MRRKSLISVAVLIMVFAVMIFAGCKQKQEAAKQPETLNLLGWVGYDEKELLEPFEKQYNVKVNVKTYVGGDQMYALFSSSKNMYDVVVVDPEYIIKLYKGNRISELNPADFDFSNYFEPFKKHPLCYIDNKMYALFIRYGSCGIVYNSKYLKEDEVKSYDILWSPKLKDKIGIWDWYLPSMGVISKYIGSKNAYDISNAEFAKLKQKLFSLAPQAKATLDNPSVIISALANEDVWAVPAAGEWIAVILKQQGKPIEWVVPKEGGIMWGEALVIPNDTNKKDLALKFLKYMQEPKTQALLTQRKAYKSSVANMKALDFLTPEQKKELRIETPAQAMDIINRLNIRYLPVQQTEKEWQDVWSEFKSKIAKK